MCPLISPPWLYSPTGPDRFVPGEWRSETGDWAQLLAGHSSEHSVTIQGTEASVKWDSDEQEAAVMTVLETEKSVTSVPSMSDRYITPEYLAHLPTSVSRLWTMQRMWKFSDFMKICVTNCDVKKYAIIVSILVPGYTEWHFSLCSLSLHKYRLSRCHKPSHFNVVMTVTNYCHRLPARKIHFAHCQSHPVFVNFRSAINSFSRLGLVNIQLLVKVLLLMFHVCFFLRSCQISK